MADLAKQRDDTSGAVETTGAGGVYAMAPNATALNQTTGLMVRVKINHDSPSGGCTFNYGGKGAKAIKVIDSDGERNPNEDELKQNAFCTMTYDADGDSSSGAWIATDIVTAALDTSNFALKTEGEATKVSAATCDIGAVTEYRVKVTGTTTITSFGAEANKRKLVRFTNALTLTHHATSLILPGGADITTAAGDVFEFASDGSGNWRCIGTQLASGKAVVASDTSTLEAQVNEIERVSKNWVQTHVSALATYSASTDQEILALETTIDNVKAGNAVEINLSISFERADHNGVFYLERNGTEILSGDSAGNRTVGLVPSDAYDNNWDSTMNAVGFTVIDESPATGSNTYTVHYRAESTASFVLNGTVGTTNSPGFERAASSFTLRERAK